jgi:predicted nucleic acid-binding Zn ribbon protein
MTTPPKGRSTWRALPRRLRDRDDSPRPIKDSLDVLAGRLGAPGVSALAAVFRHWEDAVGPAVATHARPVSLVRGTLVVEVDDSVWATQLRFLASTIVERLTAAAGPDSVARIDVRVRRR